LGLGSPGFADELIRGQASEGLEPAGEVIGVDEIAQMSSQLIVGLVEVTFDGCVLDGAVHPLDLTVGPRMLGLGQAMIDIVEGAGIFKGMREEGLSLGDHLLDLGWGPGLAGGVGEVGSVVGEDRVDSVGDSLDEAAQEVGGGATASPSHAVRRRRTSRFGRSRR